MAIPRRFLLLIDLVVVFAIASSCLYVLGFNPVPALASHASDLRVWLAGHGASGAISTGTDGLVLNPPLEPVLVPVPDHHIPTPSTAAAGACITGGRWGPLSCEFPDGKYADNLLPIPYNATLARDTTQRCGGWHRATSSDTCASMRGDQSPALFLAANPSLAAAQGQGQGEGLDQDHAECDDAMIQPGLLYCLLPLHRWIMSPLSADEFINGIRDWGCWANSDPDGLLHSIGNLTTETDVYYDEAMTPAACAKHCFGRAGAFGGDFGAIANGTACYCGTAVNVNSRQVEPDACRVPCPGDKMQLCGGADAFSLFGNSWQQQVPRLWERNGCYHSSEDVPALAHPAPGHYYGDVMDEFQCRERCFPQYLLYGLGEGGECRCGDEISPSARRVDDTKCDALCPAPRAEYCGGKGGHMDIWGLTVNRTEFASSGQRPDLAPSRVMFNFSLPFRYYDCSFEMAQPLPKGQDATTAVVRRGEMTSGPSLLDRADMSPQTCADYCISQQGRDGFALARGRDCYCLDNLGAYRRLVNPSRCNATCSGSPTESCGGYAGAGEEPPRTIPGSPPLSVYGVKPKLNWLAVTDPDVAPPAEQQIDRGRYVDHLGCMSEGVVAQEHFAKSTHIVSQGGDDDDEAPTGMTLPTCATFCVARGFRYFSLTGGRECRCGTRLGHGAVARFENTCDLPCSGNTTQICGGRLSHSVFMYNGL